MKKKLAHETGIAFLYLFHRNHNPLVGHKTPHDSLPLLKVWKKGKAQLFVYQQGEMPWSFKQHSS
jgi:hypothetical protein